MDKEGRIKKEYAKLSKLYTGLAPNKRQLADGLIGNAAFITVTLEDLQDQINREGAVIEQKNGNGFLSRMEHPAQKSYNVMVNRYNAIIKTLADLLPVEASEGKLAAILNE